MTIDIDPKVDYAFKHVFGREATRSLLSDLVDCVLQPLPGHHIRDIQLLNPFNPKEAEDDKLSILDIKARDESGRHFNIEMQIFPVAYYPKRILYYGAKLYQQQLHEGEDYFTLNPTISISFLDHVLFPGTPDHHLRFRLLEDTHRFPLTDDLVFHVLELPKFDKGAEDLRTALDGWLYFFRQAEKMDMAALPAALHKFPLVIRALEELRMLGQTELERERYEARRKAQLDYNTGMKAARLEGRAEGRAEAQAAMISMIHFAEGLLKRAQTPAEQLAQLPLAELTRLAETLQSELAQGRE